MCVLPALGPWGSDSGEQQAQSYQGLCDPAQVGVWDAATSYLGLCAPLHCPGQERAVCGDRPGAQSGGPRTLTTASGPHCEVCPGSPFSCGQGGLWLEPGSLGLPGPRASGCVLPLPGPSGLSSRSMDEMLSRLFRRLTPAAKGLAMTPGDTYGGEWAKGGASGPKVLLQGQRPPPAHS